MKKVLLLLITLLLLVPSPAGAEPISPGDARLQPYGTITYTPLEPLPCPENIPECQSGTVQFNTYLSSIFRLLITVGGLLAVVMLVFAGISYMVSESAGNVSKAKSRAKAALWGLLLLASSWLILNAINPKLLVFDLTSSVETLRTGERTSSPAPTNTTRNPQPGRPTGKEGAECNSKGGSIKYGADNSWTCQKRS